MDMSMIKLISGILFAVAIAPASQAQVTIDIAKVTCEQLLVGPIEDAVATGLWLSGYYNAKLNNTQVDLNQLRVNAETVVKYCAQNPKTMVMQAIETTVAKK